MQPPLEIVFFDMDHTLIDNDCDVSWKQFLIEEGLADPAEMDDVHRFYDLYRQGRLPILDFVAFQLRQFTGRGEAEMCELAQRHFDRHVRPRIYPQARQAVEQARRAGAPTAILTATNRIVAEPLARELGMDHVLATELEVRDACFTGRIVEPYCYECEKVTKARALCQPLGLDLERAAYFGDSTSDIPMLDQVGQAVAVNPGDQLAAVAREKGWKIERWSL
jgi:HAD superfamily hydrolase (TIGR01490 family)